VLGASIALGTLALVASLLATVGNFVIAREFPNRDLARDYDLPLDEAIRHANYRLAAKLFHLASLSLWSLFALSLVGMWVQR
jgi:hypothetical protein